MKNFYSFLLLITFSISLNAQITLTSSTNTPIVGDSFDYITIQNYAFDVSQIGPNQTWDFSSATGTIENTNVIALVDSTEPLTFPLASVVGVSNTGESYMSTSSLDISIEGLLVPGTTRDIYTDKREYLKFPITYNDVFNETFSGTNENILAGQIFDRSGNIEIKADGYGDLILPYTTVNDVLRVKVTYNYTDTFMSAPLVSYEEIICVWFNTTTNNHLASTSDVFINGSSSPSASYATYIDQSDLVLGVNDSNFTSTQIKMYPNPATNYVIFNNQSKETASSQVYDVKGVLIKEFSLTTGENKIDTSKLQSGIYLVKTTNGLKINTQKLVVK